MKNSIGHRILKPVKIIINAALILQFVFLVFALVSFFTLGSKYEKLSGESGPCSRYMALSGNNTMLVLNNEKLSDCNYSATIMVTFLKYTKASLFVKFLFSFLVLLQLSLIFRSFPSKIFQTMKNSKRIKFISLFIFLWVIIDFVIRFYPRASIPNYLIYSSVGLNTMKNGIVYSLLGLNFNFLFIAVIIYFLSLVFERGFELQDELSLTV